MKTPIQWMADNHVAANILMLVFVVGGLLIGRSIKQEVFPEFELDIVTVTVAYPGASPVEVEDGIIRPVEHAVSSINNVKRITATAREGVGTVMIEVIEGEDVDAVLNDAKAEVDRIRTFPEEAEKPVVSKLSRRHEVISLVVYGDASERAIREQAERVRDDLLALPGITQVELEAVRPYEISIEISEENLRRYNLTLDQVASVVHRASLDLPGGSVKTEGGEVLIRTREKRFTGTEFDSVTVITRADGSQVLLRDIARVRDIFTEIDQEATFDGKRAAMVQVYRVGDQTPKEISAVVNEYVKRHEVELPPTIQLAVWKDRSLMLNDRLNLLLRNGSIGFVLVLLILALFLEMRLALWVAAAIPVSFLGALLLVPIFNISINMLSLFAFIIVLGVVVDDAIIIGENIYTHRRMGKSLSQAASEGATEVAKPVVFAVLTSVAAFAPLLFVTGTMGKFFWVIPVIVISVLMISLTESLFVLPAHLSGRFSRSPARIWQWIEVRRSRFDKVVAWMIDHTYTPTLRWVAHNRYTTLALAILVLLATLGFIGGGYIKFVFMPTIDADEITVQLAMSPGTPYDHTRAIAERIQREGVSLVKEYDRRRDDGQSNLEHAFVVVGQQFARGGANTGSHLAQVRLLLKPPNERNINSVEFANRWRERIGEIPGAEELTFRAQLVRTSADIDIQLSHQDFNVLLQAVDRVRNLLSGYAGVTEVADSYTQGKRELQLRLKPEARSLGITESDLATQVRSAFYGAEALRIQRGRDEVKVMVRYPEDERRSLDDIENLRLRAPSGGEVPFAQAAYVEDTRGYSEINRTDRRRVVDVTAAVNKNITNTTEVLADLKSGSLKQLLFDYPGLTVDLEGESRERRESMGSLWVGFVMALFLIFGLLAIPFRSYTQPLVIMSAIPFGIVGAVIGHILLGYDLSLISMMGIVALTGITVNDALVMIDFINRARHGGIPLREAILQSGARRFRPIILTSLTTFFGLAPMIVATSVQSRFLVPMAISLGFGVLFSTAITLVLVPALYLILEDIHELAGAPVIEAVPETVPVPAGSTE
jgi:multidrug efflux pump subunit AcrB